MGIKPAFQSFFSFFCFLSMFVKVNFTYLDVDIHADKAKFVWYFAFILEKMKN